MSRHKFPGLRWDADGKAHHCNGPEDCDPSWTDYHPANKPENKPAPEPKSAPVPLTRAEIVEALEAGGVAYKQNASTKALHDLLVSELRKTLAEHEIEIPDGADAKTLLSLLPMPE